MPVTINASPSNGLVQTADGSGIIRVQSNGVNTNATAWVNFNGSGGATIRSSYNVSSVTRNATGDYTVNFATALTDANYCATFGVGGQAGGATRWVMEQHDNVVRTTTQLRLYTLYSNSTTADSGSVSVAIFGN